jgi:F-type H+-transporting ATPase subunit a
MKIFNPLEQFEIEEILSFSTIFGSISITNSAFYIFIAILIFIISLSGLLKTKSSIELIGNKNIIISESIYNTILSMVKDQIGNKNEIYLPFIFVLFNFILFINLIGLIPYSFTATAHFALTLSLSIAIIIGTTIIGFEKHKIKFFSVFIPSGTPLGLVPLLVIIEFLSYLARALSLGIRLGANLLAGHSLLKILSTFTWKFISTNFISAIIGIIPIVLITLLMGMEIGIGILQAMVFCILTCSYIRDSINLH